MISIIHICRFKKTIISLCLTAALLAVSFVVVLAEEKCFNISEEIPSLAVSEILLVDKDYNGVTELKAGEKIKASVEVKNISDTDTDLSLIIVLSSANRVKDVFEETKNVGTASGPVLIEKEITLPDNTDNLELSVMLWNNMTEMVNVCPALKIPENGSGLRVITADGVLLDGFDEDTEQYEVRISSNLTSPVAINGIALDGGTCVKITNPVFFPGETVINTVSRGGETKDYLIKYVCDETLVSEPVLYQQLNSRYKPVVKSNLSLGDDCFSDKASGKYSVFTSLDKTLQGKSWICCPANWAVLDSQKKIWNGESYGSVSMFEISLKKSAVIRVICEDECSVDGSFSESDGWKKTLNVDSPYYTRSYEGTEKYGNIMYEKNVYVNDGEELISIPNHGGKATYIIAVDYLYN